MAIRWVSWWNEDHRYISFRVHCTLVMEIAIVMVDSTAMNWPAVTKVATQRTRRKRRWERVKGGQMWKKNSDVYIDLLVNTSPGACCAFTLHMNCIHCINSETVICIDRWLHILCTILYLLSGDDHIRENWQLFLWWVDTHVHSLTWNISAKGYRNLHNVM